MRLPVMTTVMFGCGGAPVISMTVTSVRTSDWLAVFCAITDADNRMVNRNANKSLIISMIIAEYWKMSNGRVDAAARIQPSIQSIKLRNTLIALRSNDLFGAAPSIFCGLLRGINTLPTPSAPYPHRH